MGLKRNGRTGTSRSRCARDSSGVGAGGSTPVSTERWLASSSSARPSETARPVPRRRRSARSSM
eukprot:10396585-Lingulodinium_polyedra.AAC.1